jgi:hypothetical protein
MKRLIGSLLLLAALALPQVAQAREIVDTVLPRAAVKETPRKGTRFKESSKLGAPAEKYDYIYRARDTVRAPDKHDVI